MGIYDREYYRDETRGSGFFSGAAPACKAIILINVAVFVAEAIFPGGKHFLKEHFAAHSDAIFRDFEVWQLVTATFLHQNPFHILFNMLFLWMAGREMEAMYGSREFVGMYLTAAATSTLCWAIADRFGSHPGVIPMIGASGAVMAVIVLYALYYPRREIMLWGILRLEIWMLVAFYIGMDLLSLIQETQGGAAFGVAFASHLGGAAYGYLYKTYDLRWTRLLSARRRRPRLRVVTPEPRDKVSPLSTSQIRTSGSSAPRTTSAVVLPEEQLDARLDEVLAKIAREGRGGLTEEENRVLQAASQRARDRRSDRL